MYRNTYRNTVKKSNIIEAFPLTFSGNPKSKDRFGWPVEKIQNHLILDWCNDDGLKPYYGPDLSLDGSVITDESMPFVGLGGKDIKGTNCNSTGLLKATTGIPTISENDDWYIAVLVRVGPDDFDPAILKNIVQFGGFGGQSWDLRTNNQTLNLVLRGDSTVQTWLGAAYNYQNSINFYQVSIDKSADAYYFINDYYKNLTCPTGSIYKNNGFSISGYHDSLTYMFGGAYFRVMVFAGPNIGTICQANSRQFMFEMYYSVIGLNPNNGVYPDFSRVELTSNEQKNKLWFYGYNCPVVSYENGITINPAITQKCYKNYDQDTGDTGLTLSAGSFTWPDESSSLAAAAVDVSVLGPKVAQFANSSGSDQYITSGAATGNTNPHSLSGYVRITAGSGARIGLLHTGGAVFQDLGAVGSTWDRLKINGATPAANDAIWCIMVPDGCTVQLTGQQNEEFSYVTDFLPNNLTAATVSRTTDKLITNQIIDNDKGGIEFNYKSKYTGNVSTLSRLIVPSSTGTRFFFIYNYTVRSLDGSTTMVHPVNICDENWHHISIKWDASISKRWIDVDNILEIGDYDGSWSGPSETFKIGGHVGFCEIKNFRVLRG